jgi:mannose-1-phosphate guanylyltransferase
MVTDESAPVIPVVLSDRSGTKLQPSSLEQSPKQFRRLISGLSLFQETVCSAQVATSEPPVVVCDVQHRGLVTDQLERLGVTPAAVVCGPTARSATSAVAAAALAIGDERPDALLLVLPCDHLVGDGAQVVENLGAATLAAAAGYLVAFAFTPANRESGSGQARRGPAATPGLEKQGRWLRHSGMLLVSRRVVLAELTTHEPATADGVESLAGPSLRDSGLLPLELASFDAACAISLDCAATDPKQRAGVLRPTGSSDDVGPSPAWWEASSVVRRPWGSYQSVDVGRQHQVKRIIVEPGKRLSLQRHRRRAEHWVVVQGTACIVRGEESRLLHENESVFIPVGCAHRLENPGPTPLHLVEVQVGDYLGEDDIERLADDYGRA